MEEIVKDISINDLKTKDVSTGLYPFMLVAMEPRYDFDSIFELTKKCPKIVKLYDDIDSHRKIGKRKRDKASKEGNAKTKIVRQQRTSSGKSCNKKLGEYI